MHSLAKQAVEPMRQLQNESIEIDDEDGPLPVGLSTVGGDICAKCLFATLSGYLGLYSCSISHTADASEQLIKLLINLLLDGLELTCHLVDLFICLDNAH